MNQLYFIIGSSGAGKTTVVKNLEKVDTNFNFFYFDSVGVPSPEEMNEKYGSGENWQKEITKYWVNEIKSKYLESKSCILDGQIRPSFIKEACELYDVGNYKVILFDCEDDVREKRLVGRGHPELVNKDMRNWSKLLKEETISMGYLVVDTSQKSLQEVQDELVGILNK